MEIQENTVMYFLESHSRLKVDSNQGLLFQIKQLLGPCSITDVKKNQLLSCLWELSILTRFQDS